MNLPIQSEPVRRTMAGQPSAGVSDGAWPRGAGVEPSQFGLPTGRWDDMIAYIQRPPVALTTFPMLGPGLPV